MWGVPARTKWFGLCGDGRLEARGSGLHSTVFSSGPVVFLSSQRSGMIFEDALLGGKGVSGVRLGERVSRRCRW